MKLRPLLPTALLLLFQIPISLAVIIAIGCAKTNWAETLGNAPLPLGTTLGIKFGVFIPMVAATASLVVGLFALKRQIAHLGGLFLIAACEAMMLAFLSFGLWEPALSITYRNTDAANAPRHDAGGSPVPKLAR
jgi:hypothetical protein